MKKYKVTKKQIIEAILTEPLKAGQWFQRNNEALEKDDGMCEVCAVGAILRNVKRKATAGDAFRVTNHLAMPQHLEYAYDLGNFMSILSTEFESFTRINNMNGDEPEVRMHLLNVIEAHCPRNGITITI